MRTELRELRKDHRSEFWMLLIAIVGTGLAVGALFLSQQQGLIAALDSGRDTAAVQQQTPPIVIALSPQAEPAKPAPTLPEQPAKP